VLQALLEIASRRVGVGASNRDPVTAIWFASS